MKIRYLTAVMALVLPICCTPAVAGDAQQICETPPLLRTYDAAGQLQHLPDGRLALQLVADLHSADCGAPDCYGTNLVIQMKLQKRGKACLIRDVLVSTREFFGPGCEHAASADNFRQEKYTHGRRQRDLANPQLKKLTLRNRDGGRAIVLWPENFFYFPEVKPGGILHARLPADDDESCCWGSSSSSGGFVKEH